jgi:hypothetical protein
MNQNFVHPKRQDEGNKLKVISKPALKNLRSVNIVYNLVKGMMEDIPIPFFSRINLQNISKYENDEAS